MRKKGVAPIIIILLLLILTGGSVYYFGIKKGSTFQVPSNTPTFQPVPSAKPTSDPTEGWKLYKNSIDKFSFKYPTTWTIDLKGEKGDERKENIHVVLTKNNAKISIWANMMGIGGVGQNYEGKTFVMDGNKLFLIRSVNTFDKMQMIGVTDTLTESLGVFRVSNKTYSIYLSYPLSYSKSEATDIENEFNLILSTFKFSK